MRSDILSLGAAALALLLAGPGCAKPGTQVCAPFASWSTPAMACSTPEVAVVEPEPEPPPPEEPEPPPPVVVKVETIELRDTVQFESNSAKLLAQSETLLDEVAKILAEHPELLKVSIEGHTDSVGSDSKNQKLSERRADSVRDYLVKQGIAKARLTIAGFGESTPVADNETDDGKFQNRRVEFKIVERAE